MIKFKDLEYRDKAIVYLTTLEQIKKIYEKNPAQAGELAIAAIEVALSGGHSSDDYMIDVILEQAKYLSTKNKESYEKTVDAKKEKRIAELQLREIIELMEQGFNQTQIAAKLGTSKQNVSKRVSIIRSTYPELLSTSQPNLVDDNKKQLTTTGQLELVDDNLTEETLVDLVDNLSTRVDSQLKNSGQFDNQVNQVNYTDNDNDTVNDNDTTGPFSPSGENLPLITYHELSQMGAEYKELGGGVIEFSTGVRMKLKMEYDF